MGKGEFGETISNDGVVSKAAAVETLRYRFPKSPSKNFQDALEYAQGLPGFRQEGSEFWVEFSAGETPGNEFRELERLSKNWKGVGHFIGNKRVTQTTWWETLNPFGKFAGANVADNWIERKLWLDWGYPENLVVGESYRQGNLRGLAGVDDSILTLHPFTVTLEREPGNSHDRNAIKALAGGVHVGYLAGERAAVVGPAMDQAGIKEMKVAGVLSGSTDLGMHIWPGRRLTDGIMVGDPNRPLETCFHDEPKDVYETYLKDKRQFRPANAAAREFTAPNSTEVTSAPPVNNSLDGCAIFFFALFFCGALAFFFSRISML